MDGKYVLKNIFIEFKKKKKRKEKENFQCSFNNIACVIKSVIKSCIIYNLYNYTLECVIKSCKKYILSSYRHFSIF